MGEPCSLLRCPVKPANANGDDGKHVQLPRARDRALATQTSGLWAVTSTERSGTFATEQLLNVQIASAPITPEVRPLREEPELSIPSDVMRGWLHAIEDNLCNSRRRTYRVHAGNNTIMHPDTDPFTGS